jgi:hypothetical protein
MGARPLIQRELWHSNLNPEITLWGDVLAAAEVVEIAKELQTSGNLMIVKRIIILIVILTALLEPITGKEDSIEVLLVFQLLERTIMERITVAASQSLAGTDHDWIIHHHQK